MLGEHVNPLCWCSDPGSPASLSPRETVAGALGEPCSCPTPRGEAQLSLTRAKFFLGELQSVRAAREFARALLREWELSGLHGSVVLCVSELATNALLHGAPPDDGFWLRAGYDGAVLRVEVRDGGAGAPCVGERAPDESGRGLMLVAASSDAWGVDRDADAGGGKTVWCEWKVP
ncbi:ATP-binding protein [Streptomyces uncialis]|uniref:ATP-binding protein n=1 Tax=Streptomyces uncialis TaxID=1048205 RepID=UPI003663CC60